MLMKFKLINRVFALDTYHNTNEKIKSLQQNNSFISEHYKIKVCNISKHV